MSPWLSFVSVVGAFALGYWSGWGDRGDAGAQRSTSATVGHEIANSGTGEDAP